MKNALSLVISVCLITCILSGNEAKGQSSEEVLVEFKQFQDSLSRWMKKIESIPKQFSTLEKNLSERLAHVHEFHNEVQGIEDQIKSLGTRVQAVEEATSVAEVKEVLNSFRQTFDVFKKLFSDLKKRVEDQEVKTAVLEKKYNEAERPLEPFKQAVEDMKNKVNDTIAEQEKLISEVQEKLQMRVAAFDEKLKYFEELDDRVKKLEETGIGTITAIPPQKTPVEAETVAEEKEEEVVAEEGKPEKEEKEEVVKTPEEEGYKDIGEGFYVRDLNLLPFGSSSQIQGEIKNLSGKNRSIVSFVIKVYDESDVPLFTQDFSIRSFMKDEIRSFNEILTGYSPLDIVKYEIAAKRSY